MPAMDTVYGKPHQLVRVFARADFQAAVNGTTTRILLSLPTGCGPYRIEAIGVAASAVPADADGTFLLSVLARDNSEGGADTIVAAADMEALITVSAKAYDLTLVAETSEEERILDDGDTLYVSMTNNSAAVESNPNFTVTVALVPLDRPGDQNVKRRGSY